ncbi:MAG: NADH:ubiquinone reductase (Na(+)-transporting) subunit B [Prevotella sp.]|nr:NADH:ubiquinone reductase (Na(+)-transporting) subunit B [Prevotella sp.]
MGNLREYIDRIKPNFEAGGKFSALRSVFEGFESFLYVPNNTSKSGVHIHDAIDSKRIMSMAVIALLPALLFGMYNIGYQNALIAGKLAETGFWAMFGYGLIVVLPKIIVSYVVGLAIEFCWAQWKKEEIQEGYLVTGIVIPMIIPANCPLWMLAIACAFAVIIGKEIFGGTGMNIFNPALLTRAFLFFSYPSKMSGDTVWVADRSMLGMGYDLPDGITAATPLGELAQTGNTDSFSLCDAVTGLIPGSIGETSVIAIAIGALILLWAGISSWKVTLSVFIGGAATAWLFHALGMSPLTWYEHLVYGGFCFGAVFMAPDPVTSCRTEKGKYIYGVLIGIVAIVVRVMNPGYPEGMMLAILLMNMFSATIDHYVVEANIRKRAKRVNTK